MTACSDPGIVFEVKEFESTHHDEEHDVEMIAGSPNQSQPYSPIRSTDLIHHDAPDPIDEPDLLNTSNDGGIVDIEGGDASNNYRNQDVHASELAKVPINNTTIAAHTHVVDSVANRIVVGAAQRASRGAHLSHSSSSSSNSSNILASTPINAPYLPPPTKIECGRCQLMRPRDASHCHDCGVCVKKLDHHCPVIFICCSCIHLLCLLKKCLTFIRIYDYTALQTQYFVFVSQWTGKCIGEKTLRTFYAFLISLCVLIAFVVIVVVVAFAQSKDIFNFHRVR